MKEAPDVNDPSYQAMLENSRKQREAEQRKRLLESNVPRRHWSLTESCFRESIAETIVKWVESTAAAPEDAKSFLILEGLSAEQMLSFACLKIIETCLKTPLLVDSVEDLGDMLLHPSEFEMDLAYAESVLGGGRNTTTLAERLQSRLYVGVGWLAEDSKSPSPPSRVRSAVKGLVLRRTGFTLVSCYSMDMIVNWYGQVFASRLLEDGCLVNFNGPNESEPYHDRRLAIAGKAASRRNLKTII